MGDIARNENFEISAITVLRLRAIWQRFCRTDLLRTKALGVLDASVQPIGSGLKPNSFFLSGSVSTDPETRVHVELHLTAPKTLRT